MQPLRLQAKYELTTFPHRKWEDRLNALDKAPLSVRAHALGDTAEFALYTRNVIAAVAEGLVESKVSPAA